MSAPELNNKINISLAAIVSLVGASFILGGVWIKQSGEEAINLQRYNSLNAKIDQVAKTIDGKLVDEVGGLRADMEKEDVYIRLEIKDVKEDGLTRQRWMMEVTDKTVQTHEKIYHKKN